LLRYSVICVNKFSVSSNMRYLYKNFAWAYHGFKEGTEILSREHHDYFIGQEEMRMGEVIWRDDKVQGEVMIQSGEENVIYLWL